ncbi:MAG TPA: hypothetical protein VGH88_03535, partial [Streptosporangiaceae bacterium]
MPAGSRGGAAATAPGTMPLNLPAGGGAPPAWSGEDTVTASAVPAAATGPSGWAPPADLEATRYPPPDQEATRYQPADSPPAGYQAPGYRSPEYQPPEYPPPEYPPPGSEPP